MAHDPSPPEDAEEPWEEVSTDEYGERAAESISYRLEPPSDPTDVVFDGPCPRCSHPFVYAFPLVVIRGVEATGITVYCQCSVRHQGAPEKINGCGAYWKVLVPLP